MANVALCATYTFHQDSAYSWNANLLLEYLGEMTESNS